MTTLSLNYYKMTPQHLLLGYHNRLAASHINTQIFFNIIQYSTVHTVQRIILNPNAGDAGTMMVVPHSSGLLFSIEKKPLRK